MKKSPPASRSAAIMLVESVIWIAATFLVRARLDQAAARWQIAAPWLILLKIGVVFGLIAIAVALHSLLFRWLARWGVIPAERQE